jgi:4-alpha-glucanotransferase
MFEQRCSGVLLHPTSLAGPDGIGDLGPGAYQWVDFLAQTETALWQVLPLNPTGFGDSPYQSFSAFAGNHYLIASELLLDDGLLVAADLADRPTFLSTKVDYGTVIDWKLVLLERAYQCFQQSGKFMEEVAEFRTTHAHWLENYAVFMALKDAHGGVGWLNWAQPFRDREPDALAGFIAENQSAIERHYLWQYLFFRQWSALRAYAHQHGVRIIGDMPIYVAHDSSDVWANRELYQLDASGQASVVAGVPPDLFSDDGQLWGNPIYRWELHQERGYAWWLSRFTSVLELVDYVRLDHFRGFAGYWEVPYGETTAINGEWIEGPGASLFDIVKAELGELPLIAEDLGVITPDVVALRERYGLPGMKIFQMGFDGDADDEFLPHTYPENCVAYTGTHDNQTAVGWYQGASAREQKNARVYLNSSSEDFAWDLMRALWASRARVVVAPLQDLLSLDDDQGRMNFPGTKSGNWDWRYEPARLDAALIQRFRELNRAHQRGAP